MMSRESFGRNESVPNCTPAADTPGETATDTSNATMQTNEQLKYFGQIQIKRP